MGLNITEIITILRLGPREYYRQKFKLPIVKFVHNIIELYTTRTKSGVQNIREILLKGIVVAFITSLLVWLAIFMYAAFYYAYVPAVLHEKPVYLQFRACEAEKGICTFPSAHVELTKRQQLLMIGQPYKIRLELEMPESPANKGLGMFMVCANFHGASGKVLANSCRSTMMHYKSTLVEVMYTMIFSPFFLFAGFEEKQNLVVELFSDYLDDEVESVTDVYIEIQSKHIELYSAKFLINAHFTGLRYLMFNWPIVSAAIGITINLFCIALICMVSWYQLIHSEEYQNYVTNLEKLKEFETTFDYDSSSSIEDASLIESDIKRRKKKSKEDIETLGPDTSES